MAKRTYLPVPPSPSVVLAYVHVAHALREFSLLLPGKPVYVTQSLGLPGRTAAYEGYAMAVIGDHRPDQVACKLENGNIWYYPIECVRQVRVSECPAWLKKALRKRTKLVKASKAMMKPS